MKTALSRFSAIKQAVPSPRGELSRFRSVLQKQEAVWYTDVTTGWKFRCRSRRPENCRANRIEEQGMAAQQAEQWVHLNGKLVPKCEANISIYDHGFLYGDGAFEGIRVYSRNIFRLDLHLTRLYRSVHAMGFALTMDKTALQSAIVETVRANGLDSGYIRVSVSRGIGLGLDPSHIRQESTIIISTEQLRLYAPEMYTEGLVVITAS